MARPTRNQTHSAIEEIHCYGIMLDDRQIFLHGEVEQDYHVHSTTANCFLKNMSILQERNNKPIIVHQHSWGGEWDSGMLMYDAIKCCPATVIMICHGAAVSMGSIVMQAADKRIMMPNATFMAHKGYAGGGELVHDAAQSAAAWEARLCKEMINIYAEVMQYGRKMEGEDLDEIKRELNDKFSRKQDWYLSSAEAVEWGFSDGIFGSEEYPDLKTIIASLDEEE
jgi:ATP-dependent Clp endopeptidase proteolytic subunit ClpP